MLKKICLFFLFVFVFSAGTIVGSHFKNQIDRQKHKVTQSIKKLGPDDEYYGQQAKYNNVAELSKDFESEKDIEEVEEESKPEPKKKVKRSRKMPQKRQVSKKKPAKKKSSGRYTVQVASFPSSALANEMARKLKDQGHDAQVFSAEVKGKTWHRVGIGSFSTIGDANKKQRQLVLDKVARSSIISKMK